MRRLYNVLQYVVDADLEPIAQGCLASVAQLYMLGCNNEAGVMARSALQAALELALARARGTEGPGGTSSDVLSLVALIRSAGPSGWSLLDASGVRDADDLTLAGNHALHTNLWHAETPRAPGDSSSTSITSSTLPQWVAWNVYVPAPIPLARNVPGRLRCAHCAPHDGSLDFGPSKFCQRLCAFTPRWSRPSVRRSPPRKRQRRWMLANDRMSEAEVSVRLALYLLQRGLVSGEIDVAIDGA